MIVSCNSKMTIMGVLQVYAEKVGICCNCMRQGIGAILCGTKLRNLGQGRPDILPVNRRRPAEKSNISGMLPGHNN